MGTIYRADRDAYKGPKCAEKTLDNGIRWRNRRVGMQGLGTWVPHRADLRFLPFARALYYPKPTCRTRIYKKKGRGRRGSGERKSDMPCS
jgi:hypothetical protein